MVIYQRNKQGFTKMEDCTKELAVKSNIHSHVPRSDVFHQAEDKAVFG